MTRRFILVLVCIAGIAVSCSTSDTLHEPRCTGESSALLAAQSVQSASLLPCFTSLPAGWETEDVQVTESGTMVTFESDRAGKGAAQFTFAETCDIGGASATESEYEGVERFDITLESTPRFRAKRHYKFDGGCVSWNFDFDDRERAELSEELAQKLVFLARRDVSDDLRENFVDEEL